MPQNTHEGFGPITQAQLLQAVRQLSSVETQKELVRVYASTCISHDSQCSNSAAADVRVKEAAAAEAMERISAGTSANLAADIVLADQWSHWHAQRVAADAQRDAQIAGLVAELLTKLAQTRTLDEGGDAHESQQESTGQACNAGDAAHDSASEAARPTSAASPQGGPLHDDDGVLADSSNADTHDFHENSSSGSSNNSNRSNVLNVDAAEKNADSEEAKKVADSDDDDDDEDVPAKNNASTRSPSTRETVMDGRHEQDAHNVTNRHATLQKNGLAFPKLTPPAMNVDDINGSHTTAEPTPFPTTSPNELKIRTALPHPPRRLCFEDYDFHFTQADFDVACAEVKASRGGAVKAAAPINGPAHATTGGLVSATAAPAQLSLSGSKLAADRPSPPPPPRQVEDTGLHYIRRQLFVRHLQPFERPLKALTLRLAEGDTASAAPLADAAHEIEHGAAPRLADPLMRCMVAELRDVCELRPVPRVRVRPDAQVSLKDRGNFKADEVRVQLHVEVVPVSGPMAGETVHVWVRVPAGYPFVAPRAHLTVELPHRRCTGVAVDKVPHLIALAYDGVAPDAGRVCPAPVHAGEVEQLVPLHGPVNSGWRPGLTLRHVLVALADLFNAEEFAETARELQNENLMHSGLQRGRVNMYEEEDNTALDTTVAAVARRSSVTTPQRAAGSSSNEDDRDSTGEDSMGVTTNADEEASPSYLLLCNGPFLTKPPAAANAPVSPTLRAGEASPDQSVDRESTFDLDDDEAGPATPRSPTSRRTTVVSRRRQRRPLAYHEMESDRVEGPWRGCWGHVLFSPGVPPAPSTTAASTTVSTSVSSPIRTGAMNATEEAGTLAAAAGAGGAEERSAFEKLPPPPSPSPPPPSSSSKQAPQSLLFSPPPLHPTAGKRAREGGLFIRLRHHVKTAAAATVRLVHVPAGVLREQGSASLANTPLRRSRGRLSPQSAWVTAALGTLTASTNPTVAGTAWTSAAPADMESDLLLCIHDAEERSADGPAELEATQTPGCQRQHVNLRNLRDASALTSGVASSSNNVAVVTAALAPQGSPMTAETNSTHTSESMPREEDGAAERCYAVVVDVPDGQQVSFVFSSDEEACLTLTWEPAAAAESGVDAVRATAHWNDGGSASSSASRRGLLVELPYDEWQFHAAPAASALANGAKREEDVHPHWPRAARFHGGHRVVPMTLLEPTFRMYQLLQNAQMGSRSNVQASCYLAAAPHARVRQVYAATRNTKDQESMIRRHGFWGWRNLLLPLLSAETQELVQAALQLGSRGGTSGGAVSHASASTSAKMLATALAGWEKAALEEFGAACVQLHRDPDASLAYRAPFRTFAVLRTLALTVAYALEVMQTQQQQQHQQDAGREESEAAALLDCLNQVLWGATVLAVAMAAVRPAFLEVCVALVDVLKSGNDTQSRAAVVARWEREVGLTLSQLTPLQRGAAQVLAASTVSAFPREVAALITPTNGDAAAVEENASGAAAESLSERVAQLLNAPTSPMLGNAAVDDLTAASAVNAFTKLILSA